MDSPRAPLFYDFGGFRLDTVQRLLISTADGAPVPLSARVFETLLFLVQHAGELVEKGALMSAVWPHLVVEENNLNQSISALRRLLGESPGEHRFIVTVPGRGYRFVAPVVAHSGAPLAPHRAGSTRTTESAPPESVEGAAAVDQTPGLVPHRAPSRWLWPIGIALGLGILVVVGVLVTTALFDARRGPPTLPSEFVALTDFAGSATAPALSADGRTLAFIEGGAAFLSSGQVYVKSLPDGRPMRLTASRSPKYAPAFSPDGSRIAYSLIEREGDAVSWDTWTVSVTGGESSRLLPNASGLTWLDARSVLYSEISTGLHMGIVTATENRAEHREIYRPAHERAMAHFSYPSPDRKSVLVVEMDRTSTWLPCRLVPFDGSSAGSRVGPVGRCRSAAWSPNGKWMYFAVDVAGRSHLWRQRFPAGTPEQITFGPTEEECVIATPDGRAVISSVGIAQSTLWLHDASGAHAISTEGLASHPWLSPDAKRVYFLSTENAAAAPELWSMEMGSAQPVRRLPGFAVTTFAISRDERDVVFSTPRDGEMQVWLAPLDHHVSPRLLVRGGDQVAFDAHGQVFFRELGESANYLARIGTDGAPKQRVLRTPILNFFSVSPDGNRVVVYAPGEAAGETLIVRLDTGTARRIQAGSGFSRWSADGRFFYRDVGGVFLDSGTAGKTLIYAASEDGDPFGSTGEPATAHEIGVITQAAATLSPGPDPATYVFVKPEVRRNIFRIPIH